jgi:hypothetical protein
VWRYIVQKKTLVDSQTHLIEFSIKWPLFITFLSMQLFIPYEAYKGI